MAGRARLHLLCLIEGPARSAAAALLLLLSAACVGPAADTTGPDASAAPTGTGSPAAAPMPPPASAEPKQEARLPPPAAKPAAPALPPLPPEKLIGLEDAAIADLLGRPSFRRADAPAELWRYRAGHCILDLFLYPPRGAPGGPLSVAHVEARRRDGAPAPAAPCLDAIRKARAGGGTT